MILFIGLHKFLNSNNSSAKLILQSDFFNLYGLSYLLSEFDYPDEGIRIVDDKCKVKQSKVIFGLYSALPLSLPLVLSSHSLSLCARSLCLWLSLSLSIGIHIDFRLESGLLDRIEKSALKMCRAHLFPYKLAVVEHLQRFRA